MKSNKENQIDRVHISRILGGEIENEPIEQFQLMKGLLNKINNVIRQRVTEGNKAFADGYSEEVTFDLNLAEQKKPACKRH